MRRTKIVATVGPSSRSPEVLKQLVLAGMDVARINLSHGTVDIHRQTIRQLRQIERDLGRPIGILMDTAGPEIRVTTVPATGLELAAGTVTQLGPQAPAQLIPDQPEVLEHLKPGMTLVLDDGNIVLEVLEPGTIVTARVKLGGFLADRKKMICPQAEWHLDILTDHDRTALAMGIEEGVDWIAASFVRSAEDIFTIRRTLEASGAMVPVMAKIENAQAVRALESIVTVADGVMVARGDLGIELPVEQVPWLQKKIIDAANRAGKPVVTATQMLESMVSHPRPTRAEVSDVAHAILDGTDAVMLSAETASGEFPVQAVQIMAQVAETADQELHQTPRRFLPHGSITEAVSHASVTAAEDLDAKAILTATESGSTAMAVAAMRPRVPIVALSPYIAIARRLCLVWGIQPVVTERSDNTDAMMDNAVRTALSHGWVESGDRVVLTAGLPIGQPGTTNLMRVITIGEILLRGQGIGITQAATGPVVVVRRHGEASADTVRGKILVAPATDEDWLPLMQEAAALVVETGGLTSHAAIVGLTLGKPVVVGADRATELLSPGLVVTVDGAHGLVYRGVVQV